MSNLIKWPFSNDVFPSVKNLLEDFWVDTPEFFNRMVNTGTTLPAANIKETDKAYEIDLAVPGLKKEDLKISLDHNRLMVSSEQKSEKEEKAKDYTRREYSFSSFKRSFVLPEDVNQDAVGATYVDGVLHLSVPKQEAKAVKEAREIAIN
ncbi:MAG: Hsp20/alpha crystallin family protein [Candidatus Sericytochromatia bacterium]